jgi:anti-sigma regulatory factor (Ser/Thr protein kinase)
VNQEITQAAPSPTDSGTPTRHFALRLSSTRRGARLARLLATEQLRMWGLPHETAALVIGELTANAALHGRVPGRDFRLALAVHASGVLRIEVTDTRGDHLPIAAPPPKPDSTETEARESGHGLLIVAALADRWGVTPGPVPRKTVWAELSLVR